MSVLSRVPMLRILVPYIVGIVIASWCNTITVPVVTGIVALCLIVVLKYCVPHTPLWSLRVRELWIIPLALIAMSIGAVNSLLSQPQIIKNVESLDGNTACACIHDTKYNDHSMIMKGTLLSVTDRSKSEKLNQQHKILIITSGCNYSLQPGDIICFKSSIEQVKNMGNPNEFDYAGYLKRQGIIYQQQIKSIDDFAIIGRSTSLIDRCNYYRHTVEQQVYRSRLPDNVQAFVVATLLGDNRLIDADTRETFAQAGISHILALSGLHISVILMLVWFILLPLDYLGLKSIRLIITILSMIVFAVFTGLSASVVRATVMMTIVLLGLLFYRKSVSLNSLATAALAILAISPMALYDIGFQFSFVTVCSILLFFNSSTTTVNSGKKKTNAIVSWIASLAATSVIAMLATIMLSSFYFNAISLNAIFSNILIIPLLSCVMVVAVLFIISCLTGAEITLIDDTLTILYNTITNIATTINQSINLYFSNISVNAVNVILFYTGLTLLCLWWKTKRFTFINLAIVTITIFIVNTSISSRYNFTSEIIIFNDYYSTPILLCKNNNAELWIPEDNSIDKFKQNNSAFIASKHLNSIKLLSNENNHKILGNKLIVCAGYGKWKRQEKLNNKINIDILVITKQYHSNIKNLLELYDPKLIVLSGDIYSNEQITLEQECIKYNKKYHSIKKQGALQIKN